MSSSSEEIILHADASISRQALRTLYTAVGWTAYTNDMDKLIAAIEGSRYVVTAIHGDAIVGLTRCVSDDASICYIQDILVDPAHQRKGLGRRLVMNCLERFAHVRQKVLITDDRPEQLAFYKSLGFHNTRELTRYPLNCFVRFEGVDLE